MEDDKKLIYLYKEILSFEFLPLSIMKSEVFAMSRKNEQGEYEGISEIPVRVKIDMYDQIKCELMFSPGKPISKCFEK